mmetsp:Transcript_16970/g.55511  ORF Transcript_16970/g.55511 Transcript_16970/m.55511 type:complete len:316 (+) Transcript_16970:789-1736(+)
MGISCVVGHHHRRKLLLFWTFWAWSLARVGWSNGSWSTSPSRASSAAPAPERRRSMRRRSPSAPGSTGTSASPRERASAHAWRSERTGKGSTSSTAFAAAARRSASAAKEPPWAASTATTCSRFERAGTSTVTSNISATCWNPRAKLVLAVARMRSECPRGGALRRSVRSTDICEPLQECALPVMVCSTKASRSSKSRMALGLALCTSSSAATSRSERAASRSPTKSSARTTRVTGTASESARCAASADLPTPGSPCNKIPVVCPRRRAPDPNDASSSSRNPATTPSSVRISSAKGSPHGTTPSPLSTSSASPSS